MRSSLSALTHCPHGLARLTLGLTVAALTLGVAAPASGATAPLSPPPNSHGITMNAGQQSGPVTPSGSVDPQATRTLGMDVSNFDGNVNWGQAVKDGAKFAYIEATDGTGFASPFFAQQYNGSYHAGLIRGAYHFARPNGASGATQADFFIAHGGGWSKDGKTLPGVLDLEAQPSSEGPACYRRSAAQIVAFATSFINEYHKREKTYPVIYTGRGFWDQCVGNAGSFASKDPLFLASWGSAPGTLPHNWNFYTFWQFASSGRLPGDQDYFNGDEARLKALAVG